MPAGRPPKFKTEEEMEKVITKYLNDCIAKKEMPNKAGVRVALDICRERYGVYKNKFPNVIKRFENITENIWVQRLGGSCCTGAIFYLKNAFADDWKDRVETDITSGGEKLGGFIVLPKKEKE